MIGEAVRHQLIHVTLIVQLGSFVILARHLSDRFWGNIGPRVGLPAATRRGEWNSTWSVDFLGKLVYSFSSSTFWIAYRGFYDRRRPG